MGDKRQISKKYLFIYIGTILFTILYSGIFLVSSILLILYGYWFATIYFMPIFLGSILILFALFPRIKRKNNKHMFVCTNIFLENTKIIADKMGSSYPKKIYIIYDANACAFKQKGEEVIAIGFPLLISMSKFEISFVIAHELAHHFQEDIKYGENIRKVELIFEELMKILNRQFFIILAGPYRFIVKRIFKEIKQISRKNEYYADFHAVGIIGKDFSKSALMRLEDSSVIWDVYLSRWIWMFNEYNIFVNIVENYNLFVTLTHNNTDDLELKKIPSTEYDTHPSIYERVLEIENNCRNNTTIIDVKEYNMNSNSLSKHFWSLYNGENINNIPIIDSCKIALEELSRKLTGEFRSIFECFTYADASPIMMIYTKISYNLYQKTQNDFFEFEKDMIIKILSFIIYEKVNPENWKIGSFFIPVIIIKDDEFDLYSIINDNFNHNCNPWNNMLYALNINAQELINNLH